MSEKGQAEQFGKSSPGDYYKNRRSSTGAGFIRIRGDREMVGKFKIRSPQGD